VSDDTDVRDLPEWLQPLAERVRQVTAEHLSPRFPTPPRGARPAAVLMLFGDDADSGPEIVLTRRSDNLRAHAGQIAFPGGSVDDTDPTPVAAALREADEEVGVRADEVDVFGELPVLWLPPNNFAVTTVLGYRAHVRELMPVDPGEVASVFSVPIARLLDPANRYMLIHPNGYHGPAFDIGTRVPLWGFTAGLISRLFEHAGWERPWDHDDLRTLDAVVGDL